MDQVCPGGQFALPIAGVDAVKLITNAASAASPTPTITTQATGLNACSLRSQHCLYFFPLPQGQESLRPTLPLPTACPPLFGYLALQSQPQTSPREERDQPEPHQRSKTVPRKSQYTSRRWSQLPTTNARRPPWLTTRSASAPLGFLPSSVAGSCTLRSLGELNNFHDQNPSSYLDRMSQ